MQETGDFLSGIEKYFGEMKLRPEQYSALGLAYIGDDVYDLIIRTIVLELGNGKVKKFHKITSSVVKAESQAKLAKEILGLLTEDELAVYRHGRNAKSATAAKNASIADYRVATGLEALMGYLYLRHDMDRLLFLVRTGLDRTGQLPEKL